MAQDTPMDFDVPASEAAAPAEQPAAAPVPAPEATASRGDFAEPEDYFALILRDGLDLPIQGLEVTLTLPDGRQCTALTSWQGAVAVPIPAEPQGTVKVEVTDAKGQQQDVCTLDASRCKDLVIVRSPKVQAEVPLRMHHQRPPRMPHPWAAKVDTKSPAAAALPPASAADAPMMASGAPWWQSNGAVTKAWAKITQQQQLGIPDKPPAQAPARPVVAHTLSRAGQPVTIVAGPECPNKDGLYLGRNNIYRAAILEASERLGLIPQALCALIECEAIKEKTPVALTDAKGNPVKDKKGRPVVKFLREVWDAKCGNADTNAAGLTQFLIGTWLSHVLLPGRYIHEQSKAKGWVRQEPVPTPPGKLRKGLAAVPGFKPKLRWAFVLSDGTTTTTPHLRWSDANAQACLAMRLDPTWSIHAAADYGYANLRVLQNRGYKLDDLPDMDKAKLMYLMHHEGEGAGPAFIDNTLGKLKGGVMALKKKFEQQFGERGAGEAARRIEDADDDVELAYRWWLSDYVDTKFKRTEAFFCAAPAKVLPLSQLLVRIGGIPITKP